MATHPFSFAAVAGALFLALTPDAIGLDDEFFREPALASAPIVRVELPPQIGPAALTASLFGADPTPTSRLPPLASPTAANEAPSALAVAVKAYLDHDVATGDRAARLLEPGLFATSAEWAALRLLPRESGFERIEQFLNKHPDWPAADWLRKRSEEALYGDPHDPAMVRAFFAQRPPKHPAGKLALARLRRVDGDDKGATALVADVWRNSEINREMEASTLAEFGALLSKADHKYRADRLLYKERIGDAMRAAQLAGPDIVLLGKARATVIGEAASDAAFAAVPKPLQNDPGLLFSTIQKLRRADKPEAAAQLMLKAPTEPALLIDGDAWWVERRMLARAMLDAGDGELAYRLSAEHRAQSADVVAEAEFHAGWIALRFLDDPTRAQLHFTRLVERAKTPAASARGYYWLGRTMEARGDDPAAEADYARAASQSANFYGQLARMKLGAAELPLRMAPVTQPAETPLPMQVAEALYRAGASDAAISLLMETAQHIDAPQDVAALAAVAGRMREARLTLNLGKILMQLGVPLDDLAFPTFGIPAFAPLEGSVGQPMIYAVARQESAFAPRATSGAGAKGLMQMLVGTARNTANRFKVAFDAARLTSDPAYNAQLGAAHLGILLQEHAGSPLLAIAAYNAGGGRVKEWVKAYGDPRDPNVDAVDWIELIPITETRNYVQRVLENLQIYRVRFGEGSDSRLALDLKSGPLEQKRSVDDWRQAAR